MAAPSTQDQAVRYSTPNVANSPQAQTFPWERPIPITPFWSTIKFSIARNFLANFTPQELSHLPINPTSKSTTNNKLTLLLQILNTTLSSKEAACSPSPLHETDHKTWSTLQLSISSIQSELGQLPEAEQTLRLMADKRADKSNLSPFHPLAEIMLRGGRYVEAEKIEREVCDWMDSHPNLGRESPQALGARRIIAEAVWVQGVERRVEAEGLVQEIWEIVEGMEGGRFAVYKEEEVGLMGGLVGRLKGMGEM